jgi:hypothetical protein
MVPRKSTSGGPAAFTFHKRIGEFKRRSSRVFYQPARPGPSAPACLELKCSFYRRSHGRRVALQSHEARFFEQFCGRRKRFGPLPGTFQAGPTTMAWRVLHAEGVELLEPACPAWGARQISRTRLATELVNVTHTNSAGVKEVLKASPHQCFDPDSVAPAAPPRSRRVRVTGGGQ